MAETPILEETDSSQELRLRPEAEGNVRSFDKKGPVLSHEIIYFLKFK